MSDTVHLGLPYLAAAQAQKHVTHNEALTLLDGLVQLSVKSRVLATPPSSPAEGDRYLVATAPTDDWAGQAGKIALRAEGLWRFTQPQEGWRLWVDNEDVQLVFDGTVWLSGVVSAAYVAMSDGTVTATAATTDTFKFRAAPGLSALVGSNDPSHGDNLLLAPNVPGLTAIAAADPADMLFAYDTSAAAHGRFTLAEAFKSISGLTEDLAPDPVNDALLIHDNSAAAARRASPRNIAFAQQRLRARSGFEFFTDFVQDVSVTGSDGALIDVRSGTGAATTSLATPGNGQVGVVQSSTGSTATGRSALVSTAAILRFGGGDAVYEACVAIPVLSTSVERFQVLIGFFDTFNGVNQVDGAFFLYDEGGVSSGSVASANWQCVTASNATRTFTATTTAVSTGYVRLGVEVNPAGTSVSFLVNGTVVATQTTNIPTAAGRECGFGGAIFKSVGTTPRTLAYDYVLVATRFTALR